MAALDVGQGLWDYVIAQGDQPIEDSVFKTNKNGTVIEVVRGGKGVYWASNATAPNGEQGAFEVYGPFGDKGLL